MLSPLYLQQRPLILVLSGNCRSADGPAFYLPMPSRATWARQIHSKHFSEDEQWIYYLWWREQYLDILNDRLEGFYASFFVHHASFLPAQWWYLYVCNQKYALLFDYTCNSAWNMNYLIRIWKLFELLFSLADCKTQHWPLLVRQCDSSCIPDAASSVARLFSLSKLTQSFCLHPHMAVVLNWSPACLTVFHRHV